MTNPPHPEPETPTGLESSLDVQKVSVRKRLLGRCIGWGSVVLAVVLGILTYTRTEHYPVSNLATLEAPIIGVASRVGGPIKALHVVDNQFVSAGETLFQIDPEPYSIAVAGAKANLQALHGDLANALREIEVQRLQIAASEAVLAQARTHFLETQETYDRIAPLLERRYATPEQVDTARRAMESAKSGVTVAEAELEAARSAVANPAAIEARIVEAEAMLAEAKLALRDCTVRAPFDCRMVGLNLAEGAFVNPGITVLMALDTRGWVVNAEFPEHILRAIRPGQQAQIQLMSAPDMTFEGRVESIGWAVSSLPDIPLPQVPFVRRELDWVRLTQRFPVRVRLTSRVIPPEILRAGVTASVTVLTDSRP